MTQTAATQYACCTLPTNSTRLAVPVVFTNGVPSAATASGQKQKKKHLQQDFQEKLGI